MRTTEDKRYRFICVYIDYEDNYQTIKGYLTAKSETQAYHFVNHFMPMQPNVKHIKAVSVFDITREENKENE